MKKSLKKSLALFLSALMVVSMLPAFAITAYADEWIKVASNNLSDSHWSWENRFDDSAWGWAMRAYTNDDDQNDLDWNSEQYYDWGDLDNGHIGNGYLYLNESTTPVTGTQGFKIDIQFTFTDSFEITNNGGNSSGGADFLILTTHDNCTWYNGDAKSNYAFKQSGYGNLSFNSGAAADDSKTSESYRIATNNSNISTSTAYHYVLTYKNGVVNAVVTDANGNTVIDYGSHNQTIDTSAIKNIIIGIGNGTDASYNYKNITYGNIDFYRTATADDFDASKLANPTYTFVPKHIDDAINSDYYSNVVYASATAWDGNGTANNSYIGIGRMDFKIATPYETVLVYDGENEASYPVALEQHRNQSSGQSQLIHYMSSYDNGFELRQDWKGGDTDYTKWPSGNDTFAYYDSDNYNESGDLNNSNNHFYANKMVYKGSGDTTNYYSTVENQKFFGKTSYKETTSSRQYKYGDVTSYSKQYVINYQPIYSILADARALADEITTNSWKYTQESIDAAKVALYLVGNCNPNNYNYASDVEGAVKQCAADIKQAKEAYDSISLVNKTFTVTFKAANGNTIEERQITAGDPLGELPANTAGATHIANTNTHSAYTWGDTTAETVVTGDAEFTEALNPVPCTFTDAHTQATELLNGYTDKVCSVCGNTDTSQRVYDDQDFTAYEEAVANYEAIIGADNYTAMYTEDSRDEYEDTVEYILSIFDTNNKELSPTQIANAAADIEAAADGLEIASYKVTYVDVNNDSTERNFEYGTEASAVETAAPALPADCYDTDKHYTYAWDTAFADVTGAATYTQVETAEDHVYTQSHTAATNESNGYTTFTCECGHSYVVFDEQDFSAYDDALDGYEEKIAESDYTAKYTADSRTAYETAVNDAKIDTSNKELSPSAIAKAAQDIEDAMGVLQIQVYAVTYMGVNNIGSRLIYFEYGASADDVAASALDLPAANYDENQHYTFSWNTAFTAVTGDATYTQIKTGEDHSFADSHTAATATENGFTTFTCDCGYSYVTYDEVADLTALQSAYDNGDAVLNELVGKAAQYDAASVQALIDAVESEDVAAYLEAADPSVFNKEIHQDTVDSLADAINNSIAGLTVAVPATEEQAAAIEVYEAAVKQINNLDPDAYDSTNASLATGISNANTVMENGTANYDNQTINVVNSNASAQDIEDATSTILTAISSAIKTYTITTTGVDETSFKNGNVTGTESPYTATYGTSVLCISHDTNTAWFLEIQTGTMHKELSFQSYGSVLRTKVMGNTNIIAVKRTEDKYRVRILRQYCDVAVTPQNALTNFADYVDANSAFVLPEAPAFAYYTFDGYYIGDEKITDTSILIDKDTDIIAKYTVNSDADCAINTTDINNVQSNSTVSYNTKIDLDGGEGTYAWVEEIAPNRFRPFYIGQKVSFYASESINLYAVSEELFNSYNFDIPAINLRQSGVIVTGSKVIFNAQVVAPDMDNVQEYGILVGIAKTGGTISNDDLIIENSGSHADYNVLRAKSTKLIPEANQFTIGVNGLASKSYIYRGYLIYNDGTTLRTVYTDIFSE